MLDFVRHLFDDLHPLLNHFPIAFLTVSFVLVFAVRKWPALRQTEWLLFCWGAIMTLPASITGLIAHEAYETSPVHMTIEQHGLPANVGTVLMLIMAFWRYRSRRATPTHQPNDIGARNGYLVFAVIGLIWIFIVGGTGGSLTYDYGINVRGSTPLP